MSSFISSGRGQDDLLIENSIAKIELAGESIQAFCQRDVFSRKGDGLSGINQARIVGKFIARLLADLLQQFADGNSGSFNIDPRIIHLRIQLAAEKLSKD